MKKFIFIIVLFIGIDTFSAPLILFLKNKNNKVCRVIMMGESNSGGYAANAGATATELSINSSLKFWDNINNNGFVDYQASISLTGHDCLTQYNGTRHGFDLELSNEVRSGLFKTPVYMVKTGQGSSRIAHWVNDTYVCTPGVKVWSTWLTRVNGSTLYMPKGKKIYNYIMYSQGINDANDHNDATTWYNNTVTMIERVRTYLPNAKFYMTHIPRTDQYYIAIDDKITALAANIPGVFAIQTDDCEIAGVHWTYNGMKKISQRMCALILADFNKQ